VLKTRAAEYRQFKKVIASIAPTYDFDRTSPLTEDARNFSDPVHYTGQWGERMTREICLDRTVYSVRLPAP